MEAKRRYVEACFFLIFLVVCLVGCTPEGLGMKAVSEAPSGYYWNTGERPLYDSISKSYYASGSFFRKVKIEDYLVSTDDVASTGLPVLTIDTENVPVVNKEDKSPGTMELSGDGVQLVSSLTIRGRGNATWA